MVTRPSSKRIPALTVTEREPSRLAAAWIPKPHAKGALSETFPTRCGRGPSALRALQGGGALITELLVAMTLLVSVLLPISLSVMVEKRAARSSYDRALAMELVDGEMEILMAGEWRVFAPGTQEYPIRNDAIHNLPEGKLLLSVHTNRIRLDWRPAEKHHGGPVVREARVP
jgi:hypothetical protein